MQKHVNGNGLTLAIFPLDININNGLFIVLSKKIDCVICSIVFSFVYM